MIHRTAGVPRGLLRFLVLRMLNDKPMSGVEIVEQVKTETNGQWEPSPGSIYPLLAWLQNKNYTHELPSEETLMKRYTLTDNGRAFFQDQRKFGQTLLKKLEFLAPMLVGGFQFEQAHERMSDIRESAQKLVKVFFHLRRNLTGKLTDHVADEIVQVLNDSAKKLTRITERLKEEP